MGRTILKSVGYALLFIVCVIVFMFLTFPMDKARHFIERNALAKLKIDLSIGSLRLWGLGGVAAEDVVIRLKAPDRTATPDETAAAAPVATAGEAAQATPKPQRTAIRVDGLRASVGLWGLITRSPVSATGEADLLGGELRGVAVAQTPEGYRITVERMADLDLAAIPGLADLIGVPLGGGKISGTFDGRIAPTLYDSRGTVTLKIEDVLLKEPEINNPQYGTFRLSDIRLGTVQFEATLGERGDIAALGGRRGDRSVVLHVARLTFRGGDIEGELEDRSLMTLQKGQPFARSYVNLSGSFGIDPRFFERTVTRAGDTEKPNLFLRTLLTGDPRWKRAERDGRYGFRCTGAVSPKPNCVPIQPPGRGSYSPQAREERASGDDSRPAPPTKLRPWQPGPTDRKPPRPAGVSGGDGPYLPSPAERARAATRPAVTPRPGPFVPGGADRVPQPGVKPSFDEPVEAASPGGYEAPIVYEPTEPNGDDETDYAPVETPEPEYPEEGTAAPEGDYPTEDEGTLTHEEGYEEY